VTPDAVRRAAEALLARDVVAPPRLNLRAWGNESWTLETSEGRVLFKVGSDGIAGKWRASNAAHRLAREAGLPVPRVLAFDEACAPLENRTVRILEWMPGADPASFLTTPAGVERFFSSFGQTVGRLHRLRLPLFSSRLDGSAPGFERWGDYVAHRARGIEERGRRSGFMEAGRLADALERVARLADELSPLVRPSLTHRDLYLENVLAGPDGRLCGLIDFDLAEAWDPAVDLVKPRWQVFPRIPGAEAAFRSAYGAEVGALEAARERLRVVDVLELANAAANARLEGRRDYAEFNRTNLERVLAAWP
jgi:Ser/Thr protein kinase RdoA (MazF antagonist)